MIDEFMVPFVYALTLFFQLFVFLRYFFSGSRRRILFVDMFQ